MKPWTETRNNKYMKYHSKTYHTNSHFEMWAEKWNIMQEASGSSTAPNAARRMWYNTRITYTGMYMGRALKVPTICCSRQQKIELCFMVFYNQFQKPWWTWKQNIKKIWVISCTKRKKIASSKSNVAGNRNMWRNEIYDIILNMISKLLFFFHIHLCVKNGPGSKKK